eukprot:455333-Rhodomonas_salina.2
MSGTGLGYATTPLLRKAQYTHTLCCYAACSTDTHAATMPRLYWLALGSYAAATRCPACSANAVQGRDSPPLRQPSHRNLRLRYAAKQTSKSNTRNRTPGTRMLLPLYYAMPGTDLGYAATRLSLSLCSPALLLSLPPRPFLPRAQPWGSGRNPSMLLRYAMSGRGWGRGGNHVDGRQGRGGVLPRSNAFRLSSRTVCTANALDFAAVVASAKPHAVLTLARCAQAQVFVASCHPSFEE